jgi:hypothetical protein
VRTAAAGRSRLGESASPPLPNAGDIPTSAFWDSARPGVSIAATPSVRSGPDAWIHAEAQVERPSDQPSSSPGVRRLVLASETVDPPPECEGGSSDGSRPAEL